MATIKKACKGGIYPKSSSVSKRLGSPSKAKAGMKIKKAQVGKKISPTYKNLPMGVKNENYQMTGVNRDIKPSSRDSARYRGGFEQGLKGSKGSIGEGNIEKMGRWEGQNVGKKKAKSGTSLGMKSVKDRYDKNPDVTRADIIAAATKQAKKGMKVIKKSTSKKTMMKSGGKMTKKCMYGCK